MPSPAPNSLMTRHIVASLVMFALAAVLPAAARAQRQDTPAPVKGEPYRYDPDNARDVMRICAGCHGESGAGGGAGVYPRLGGLNADYLADQIHKFKSRERENIPMIPFTVDRELSERDVLDIARFLSEIKIDTKPPAEMPADGFARLQIMKKVLQVPREPGEVEAGKAFYDADCRPCHGARAEGRLKRPPLAAQHMAYLKTQVESFLAGKRTHDDIAILRARSAADWTNLWAYISTLAE